MDLVAGDHHGDALLRRPVEVLLQAFLETQSVRDEEIGVVERRRLLGGDLERVRVGVGLHESGHVRLVAGDLGHDVTQDVRGDHDLRLVVGGARGAAGEPERREGGRGERERSPRPHRPTSDRNAGEVGVSSVRAMRAPSA